MKNPILTLMVGLMSVSVAMATDAPIKHQWVPAKWNSRLGVMNFINFDTISCRNGFCSGWTAAISCYDQKTWDLMQLYMTANCSNMTLTMERAIAYRNYSVVKEHGADKKYLPAAPGTGEYTIASVFCGKQEPEYVYVLTIDELKESAIATAKQWRNSNR